MTVDIILAGVPKGEDYWGPKEDRSYYATFYTGAKNEDSRFLVEVRQSGEKPYCYYNYLKYNTIDSETRGGGFFCLAMRTDMYCKDVVKVYHFLDIIFNKYVLNGILLATPHGLRYQITSFDTKNQDIQVMQNVMIDLLQKSLSSTDFVAFDTSFSFKKIPGAEVNFSDCTKENLLAAIKKYASICLSTNAWLNRERNAQQTFESQLANSVATKEQEMANIQNELNQKQSLCVKLQADVNERDSQIQQLKNEIKAKDAELKQVSIRKDVSQIIAQIKEPIARLASYTGFPSQSVRQDSDSQREEQEREDSSFFQTVVTKALPILNLIVLLGIGGYLYYSANNKFGINDNTFLLQSILESVTKENKNEQHPVADVSGDISNDKSFVVAGNDSGESSSIDWQTVNHKIISLDTEKTDNKCLVGKKYTATFKQSDSVSSATISDESGEILKEKGKTVITFTPKQKGMITISFVSGNKGFKRQISVQE